MPIHYHEIIFLLIFFIVLASFIKGRGIKKGLREFLFFSFPVIIFFFFIEFFWIYRGRGVYVLDKFYVSFLKIPLIVPLAWIAVVFFSMKLTSLTFQKNQIIKKENFLLSLSDSFWSLLFAIFVFEPLGFYLGLWQHIGIKPFLFDAPFWYFIGWFLAVFLVSFGYRVFKGVGKRNIVFLSYIFLIIVIRSFIYFILKI